MMTIGLMILCGVIYVAGVLMGMTAGWNMAHEQSPVLNQTKETDDYVGPEQSPVVNKHLREYDKNTDC